ncbi:M23 family peptidase, partial [Diaphorobacter sp. DS2]
MPFPCDPTFPPLSPSGARRRTLLQALGLALAPGMPAL